MKGHWSSVNLVNREASPPMQLVSFHFLMQTKVYFNPYIYAKATNNPQMSKK